MWRIRIDTEAKQLAFEVRDADVLMTYFYTLSVKDHVLSEVKPGQALTWWQGMEDAQDGLLYLHGYGDRKIGQHKGITGVGADKVRWEQQELSFYGIIKEGLLAYPTAAPESSFLLLDPHTGNTITTGISQREGVEAVSAYQALRYNNCYFPVQYQQGEEYFEQVAGFLKNKLAGEPVLAIEYAETNEFIICSYYRNTEVAGLENILAVFDLEGNLCLKEVLGSELKGIGSDTFLIFMGELYFVQHRNVLQVYRLEF